MCKVCTEAVHCVALWTRTLSLITAKTTFFRPNLRISLPQQVRHFLCEVRKQQGLACSRCVKTLKTTRTSVSRGPTTRLWILASWLKSNLSLKMTFLWSDLTYLPPWLHHQTLPTTPVTIREFPRVNGQTFWYPSWTKISENWVQCLLSNNGFWWNKTPLNSLNDGLTKEGYIAVSWCSC